MNVLLNFCSNDGNKKINTAAIYKVLSKPGGLNFKNLDREIKNFGLDTMDNLDGFQKLVSTVETPRLSIEAFFQWKLLKVITLGLRESHNINHMITISIFFTVMCCNLVNVTFEIRSN